MKKKRNNVSTRRIIMIEPVNFKSVKESPREDFVSIEVYGILVNAFNAIFDEHVELRKEYNDIRGKYTALLELEIRKTRQQGNTSENRNSRGFKMSLDSLEEMIFVK